MEIQYRHEKANAHWQGPILAPAGVIIFNKRKWNGCKAFIKGNVLFSVPACRADYWEWGEEDNYWIVTMLCMPMNCWMIIYTLKLIQGMMSILNRQHQKFTELSLSVLRDAAEPNISNSLEWNLGIRTNHLGSWQY